MSALLLWLLVAHPGSGHDRQAAEDLLEVEPERVDLQVERALAHWRMGQAEEAFSIVDEFKDQPDWPEEGVWLEGVLLLHRGDFVQAEERLRAYVENKGPRLSARSALADAVREQKRWEEAGMLYAAARSLTRDPDDAIQAARMAARAGEHELAVERIDTAIHELGAAVSLRVARVEILEGAGRYGLAVEELDTLLEMAPHHSGWIKHKAELTQRITERKR